MASSENEGLGFCEKGGGVFLKTNTEVRVCLRLFGAKEMQEIDFYDLLWQERFRFGLRHDPKPKTKRRTTGAIQMK